MQRFFLATDNAATQRRFRERYGPAAVVCWDMISDRPGVLRQTEQEDALADLWLLAACKERHSSNFSSFSQLAHILARSAWAKQLGGGQPPVESATNRCSGQGGPMPPLLEHTH